MRSTVQNVKDGNLHLVNFFQKNLHVSVDKNWIDLLGHSRAPQNEADELSAQNRWILNWLPDKILGYKDIIIC